MMNPSTSLVYLKKRSNLIGLMGASTSRASPMKRFAVRTLAMAAWRISVINSVMTVSSTKVL